MVQEYFHSIRVDKEKCIGCTNCIKSCPTEAIRVRDAKAVIIDERCIDCGYCIKVCPYHAINSTGDDVEDINSFKYRIVIPEPSLYGQFKIECTRNRILTALKIIGFEEIFEASRGAEIVSFVSKKLLKEDNTKKPLISSACPAVVRLIQLRFPNLIPNLLRVEMPMEVAAKKAKDIVCGQKQIPEGDIGVFFVSPCPAKITSVKSPIYKEKSFINGVISMRDIYVRICSILANRTDVQNLEHAGHDGIMWANSSGEAKALGTENYLAVDGIDNVISILEEVENDRLGDIDFIETLACPGGCIGGPLNAESVYVAKSRVNKIISKAKRIEFKKEEIQNFENFIWRDFLEYKPIMKLDLDFKKAIIKMEKLDNIHKILPKADCGICGSPSCRALAEDIVRGDAEISKCIFL